MKGAEQLEIFSRNTDAKTQRIKFSRLFLMQVKAHEKAILLVIALCLSWIVGFCLGVEKGKKIGLAKMSERLDLAFAEKKEKVVAESPKPEVSQKELTQAIPRQIPVETKVKDQTLNSLKYYTIQVASHKTKEAALREAEALKKKGFSVLIIQKGDYHVVCVGNYTTKERAKASLEALRKTYRDCYIRSL